MLTLKTIGSEEFRVSMGRWSFTELPYDLVDICIGGRTQPQAMLLIELACVCKRGPQGSLACIARVYRRSRQATMLTLSFVENLTRLDKPK